MNPITRRNFLAASSVATLGGILLPPASANPDRYADAVFRPGPPPSLAAGAFTIAVLPDTQNYSQHFPEQYYAQTDWIVANKESRKIACVLHLGDITNNNALPEWEVAAKAMQKLDGQVPYFMAVGNHDYSEQGHCVDRSTHFNEFFPLAKYSDRPEFGGVYDADHDRFENSYHFFSAGGLDFIVFCLEFGPRHDVVRWAAKVAEKHQDRLGILVTHAYMYSDETRYDWREYGKGQQWNPHAYGVARHHRDDVCDGEQLWRRLVSSQGQFVLTLNGHVLNDGLAHVTTRTRDGRDIPQILVNFQMKPNGGDGWIRLLEVRPDGLVQTYDYSPTRDECNASKQNEFQVRIAV
jgi:hypothetical protein